MEDYAISEVQNIKKKIVMIVEDDEKLVEALIPFCEVMPLRFSYNVDKYSSEYIEHTKELFSYYYDLSNLYKNEILRLKKHFKHYMRYPFILYVSDKNKNYNLILNICKDLKIECISNKKDFILKIKNDKKVFLIDSDQTLKNDKGYISEKNRKAIKRVVDNGDYAIICTARPRYHTLEIMDDISASNYIISSNGAEIFDAKKNKIIKSYYVDKKTVNYLIKICFKLDIRLVLSSDDIDFVTKNIRNESQILLMKNKFHEQLKNVKIKTCMVIDSNIDAVLNLKKIISLKDNICIINEKSQQDKYTEEWFCVGNKKANKGNGLLYIANYLKVPIINTIAIGNDYNDVPMFNVCNISISVDNADDEIKSLTKYSVASNNNNGVAEAINKVYDELNDTMTQ